MKRITDEDEPLNNFFSLSGECMSLDISSLRLMLDENDNLTCYTGLYNCLKRSNLDTVGQLLYTSHWKLLNTRNLGQRRHELLYRLLDRAVESPDTLLDLADPKTEEPIPDPPSTASKSTYIDFVIENYKNDDELKVIQAKEDRIKALTERLREMGMIN